MIRLYSAKNQWLNQAVKILQSGGLIIYPTETSYGLGADATNPAAINKLLTYKGNRLNKAISVAVASKSMAKRYIKFNPSATNVFNTLLPGPVTLIAESTGRVAPKVESERHTLGIRYSSLPLVSQLVEAFGKPITATSANTSGAKQIYSFADWQKYVPTGRQGLIDIFIDAGTLPPRPPSTIIDTTLNNPAILRQGEIVFSQATTTYTSSSPEDTINIGRDLTTRHIDLLFTKPIIFALEGDLGAGKTHFAKGVGQALEITQTITSPTYTIMREYPYSLPKIAGTLYHLDTWRLFESDTLEDVGITSKLLPGNIIIIEWQQKASQWLRSLHNVALAYIKLEFTGETARRIMVKWT